MRMGNYEQHLENIVSINIIRHAAIQLCAWNSYSVVMSNCYRIIIKQCYWLNGSNKMVVHNYRVNSSSLIMCSNVYWNI